MFKKRNKEAHMAPAPKSADPKRSKVKWGIAILACVVALVAGARLTYTAFTASDFLKAVAVTGTSQSLFASDALSPYSADPDDSPVLRSMVVDTSGDKCSFTFKIYNCLLDDPNVFNNKEVSYNLSVVATGAGDSQWSIDSQGEYDFPSTSGVIKTYTISFDKSLVDKVSFKIVAQVNKSKSPGTSLYCLAARVAPVQRSDVQTDSVRGSWVDTGDASDYDAYNYRVTATGKQQQVLLTWGEGVELDAHFEANHHEAGDSVDRNARRAIFTMDPGSEIVNFYRADDSAPSSWDEIGVNAVAYTGGN